jgi:dTDP-4-amino-4,6-dideoxygalactose transaminase
VVDDRRLSFAKSSITEAERRAVLDVLDPGWLTKSPRASDC